MKLFIQLVFPLLFEKGILAMAFEKTFEEFETRKKKTLAQGGPQKIQRQHDKGRLTARERIDKLLDPGTFMEFGAFCTSDKPGMEDRAPAPVIIWSMY